MTQGFESFLSTTQYIYTIFSVINQEFSVNFSIKFTIPNTNNGKPPCDIIK